MDLTGYRTQIVVYSDDDHTVRLRKLSVAEVAFSCPEILGQVRGLAKGSESEDLENSRFEAVKAGLAYQTAALAAAIDSVEGFSGYGAPIVWSDLEHEHRLGFVEQLRIVDPGFYEGLWETFARHHMPHIDQLGKSKRRSGDSESTTTPGSPQQ